MRTSTIIFLLIFGSCSLFSQSDINKPDIGSFGIGLKSSKLGALLFNFDSQIDSIQDENVIELRYQSSEFLSFRFGLGFSIESTKTTPGINGPSSTYLSFYPGAQYHFAGTEKLDPYLGLQVILSNLHDGDGTYGADLLTGFNWYIIKNLGIGMETGIRINTDKKVGTTSTVKDNFFGTRGILQSQIIYYF